MIKRNALSCLCIKSKLHVTSYVLTKINNNLSIRCMNLLACIVFFSTTSKLLEQTRFHSRIVFLLPDAIHRCFLFLHHNTRPASDHLTQAVPPGMHSSFYHLSELFFYQFPADTELPDLSQSYFVLHRIQYRLATSHLQL